MTSSSTRRERLLFRLPAAQIRQGVDLRGDMVHWHEPVPLVRRAGSSWLEAELALPPGVYRYKFHTTDDEWLLDPANDRTCARGGVQNNLLVVGGAGEPVMHAPVAPWLFLEDDGRICIRAGLRIGQGDSLRVRWDEGHGPRAARLSLVAVEGEHQLLEAHLPASADTLRYWFELGDGRLVGLSGTSGAALQARLVRRRSPTPDWWRDAVLYTIFVDRFRLGGTGGGWLPPPVAGAERARAGGDLRGVVEALPYLADLGVTALHLTPIVIARSAHRYDAVDPRAADDALGGAKALERLVAAAHGVGLRVLLDVTLTHVHRDFFAFRDLRSQGPRSRYWDWFRVFRFPFRDGDEPGYDHYQRGQWEEPLLRTEHPEVMDYLVGTLEHWTRFGVDGFRLDAAADVPLELLRRIRTAVRAARPEAVLFGELTVDNAARFTSGALDAATDFVSQQALYDWLWRRRTGAVDYASAVAAHRFLETGPGSTAIGLTATHDQPRLRTLVDDPAIARLGHLLALVGAAVPAIYYGDEIGLSSGEPGRNFEDAWPDRCRMPWEPDAWDGATRGLFRSALAARRSSAALRRGDERFLSLASAPELADDARDLLCLRRTAGDEVVDVLMNGSAQARRVALPGGAPREAELLCATGDCALQPDEGTASLGPWGGLVVRRVESAEDARAALELVGHGHRLGWLAFREGATDALALPTRLYVTVTEACNLRCRHCLNHSPRHTVDGTARELRPWLIGRLGEALAAADYLAFAHGGESLCSPMLWPLLDAMAERHRARPGRYDVHLLSNGMLLDGDRLGRLVDRGVTSLAVSLDGARPETNDAIRAGSRLVTVLDHLREAVRRRESGADLRVGISTVACEANVTELPALGALALDLGLDWLKIEELVPATPWARQNALEPRDGRLADAMTRLRELTADGSLVLVDHLDPPAGCHCQGESDPRLRAFREADDFANRVRFHPCRADWEQACVDPDGLVHPADYLTPAVGSLAEESMLAIWDGAAMHQRREVALARLPEALRRRCPAES